MSVDLRGHSILVEFHAERLRAFHAGGSCEENGWNDPELFRQWVEAVGDVIQSQGALRLRVFPEQAAAIRAELVRVGAMTETWIAAIDRSKT